MGKKKTGRKSKQEVFVEGNFDISQEGNAFVFTPKEGSEFTEVAKVEDVESQKTACLALYDSLNESAPKKISLVDISEKYATTEEGLDKLSHGYIPFYEKHLNEVKSLLEIGCYKGNSIRMWREYFSKDVEIATLDLFVEHPVPDIEGVRFFKGDQKDIDLLNHIESHDFQVIIDDGSHGAKDQWAVLNTFVKPGRLVIIEDLHCNADGNGFWNQGLLFKDTILGKIQSGSFPFSKFECYLDKIVFVWG